MIFKYNLSFNIYIHYCPKNFICSWNDVNSLCFWNGPMVLFDIFDDVLNVLLRLLREDLYLFVDNSSNCVLIGVSLYWF